MDFAPEIELFQIIFCCSSSPVACGPSRRLGAHEANASLCHDFNGNGNVLVGLTLLTRNDGWSPHICNLNRTL